MPVVALDAPQLRARCCEALDSRVGLAAERSALRDDESRARASALATCGCSPVPDPQKIVCLGLNYRDHAAETGQEIPAAPMWFAKFANSLIGSGQAIVLPAAHPEYVDYEAELAVVIGRTRRTRVEVAEALSHVAGAMPFNDVSARDLQLQNPAVDERQGDRHVRALRTRARDAR